MIFFVNALNFENLVTQRLLATPTELHTQRQKRYQTTATKRRFHYVHYIAADSRVAGIAIRHFTNGFGQLAVLCVCQHGEHLLAFGTLPASCMESATFER